MSVNQIPQLNLGNLGGSGTFVPANWTSVGYVQPSSTQQPGLACSGGPQSHPSVIRPVGMLYNPAMSEYSMPGTYVFTSQGPQYRQSVGGCTVNPVATNASQYFGPFNQMGPYNP